MSQPSCPALNPGAPQPGHVSAPAPAPPARDAAASAVLPSVLGLRWLLGSTLFPQRKTLQTKAEMWFAKIFDNMKRCLARCQEPHLKSEIRHAPAPGAVPTQPGRRQQCLGMGTGMWQRACCLLVFTLRRTSTPTAPGAAFQGGSCPDDGVGVLLAPRDPLTGHGEFARDEAWL